MAKYKIFKVTPNFFINIDMKYSAGNTTKRCFTKRGGMIRAIVWLLKKTKMVNLISPPNDAILAIFAVWH